MNRNRAKIRPRKSGDLLLVDALNFVFRAYFSGKASEQNEFVVERCMGMLKNLIGTFWPSGIIFVWEGIHSTEQRKSLYSGYKKKKKPLEIDWDFLQKQIELLKEFLYNLGVGNVGIEYQEADDTIAAISRIALDYKRPIMIISTDKDLWQLVNLYVSCFNSLTNITINHQNFYSIAGVAVENYIDYRCLVGDSSDNISGIQGIGPDTAKKICNLSGGLNRYVVKGVASIPRTKNLFVDKPNPLKILERNNQLMNLKYGVVGGKMDQKDRNVLKRINYSRLDKEEIKDLLEDYDMWSFRDSFNTFIRGFETMNLQEVIDVIV